jgi:hypothetical protein
MTGGEAKNLVSKLIGAYPQVAVKHNTVSLWLSELRPLDHDTAEQALLGHLRHCRWFPTIAELHEHYRIVQAQARRAAHEAERENEEPDQPLTIEENRQRLAEMTATIDLSMQRRREERARARRDAAKPEPDEEPDLPGPVEKTLEAT